MEFNLLSYSSPSDGPCLSDASTHADIEAVALVEIVEKMEPSSLLAARCYACSCDSVAAWLRHGTASRRGSLEGGYAVMSLRYDWPPKRGTSVGLAIGYPAKRV